MDSPSFSEKISSGGYPTRVSQKPRTSERVRYRQSNLSLKILHCVQGISIVRWVTAAQPQRCVSSVYPRRKSLGRVGTKTTPPRFAPQTYQFPGPPTAFIWLQELSATRTTWKLPFLCLKCRVTVSWHVKWHFCRPHRWTQSSIQMHYGNSHWLSASIIGQKIKKKMLI